MGQTRGEEERKYEKKKFVIGEHEIYHKLATINLIHKRRLGFPPVLTENITLTKDS